MVAKADDLRSSSGCRCGGRARRGSAARGNVRHFRAIAAAPFARGGSGGRGGSDDRRRRGRAASPGGALGAVCGRAVALSSREPCARPGAAGAAARSARGARAAAGARRRAAPAAAARAYSRARPRRCPRSSTSGISRPISLTIAATALPSSGAASVKERPDSRRGRCGRCGGHNPRHGSARRS